MDSQIFINLAITDLEKSTKFYTSMGFTINPQFSDESGKCLVWNEHIYLMIMTKIKFESFATKPLSDTKSYLAGLYAISVESVEKMNEIIENGLKSGGIEPKPMQDHGFMQVRNIEDLDGHTREIFYMDMSKFPKQ